MLVRYRWSEYEQGLVRREFVRETKDYFITRDGWRGTKNAWFETKAEALDAYVKKCDAEAERFRGIAREWNERAKKAYVLHVQELAGVTFDDSVGEGDGRSEGSGNGEGAEGTRTEGAEDEGHGAAPEPGDVRDAES